MQDKMKGVLYGAVAASSYGMNPLFALPLYNHGVGVNSTLFYRYVIAVVFLFLWIKIKKHSFYITIRQCWKLFWLGILFSLSSLFLFMSYNYMDAGVASTILFIYPVLVAMIMTVFYKEKLTLQTGLSIMCTLFGVYFLYTGKPNGNLDLFGMLLVFLSALSYAIYIVAVNKTSLKYLQPEKLTFYVLLFGSIVYIINTGFCTNIETIPAWYLWINAFGLALLPTIVSIETMAVSIKLLGATPAAILGTLEPVTALFFGVTVFHEVLTFKIIYGIILILAAVVGVILKPDYHKWIFLKPGHDTENCDNNQ